MYQELDHNFCVPLQSITVLNAGSFIQEIYTRTEPNENKPLRPTRKPTILDMLLRLHSVNMVLHEQSEKELS